MNRNRNIVLACILAMLTVISCGISFGENDLSDEAKLQTAVAETVTANQVLKPADTQTVAPTVDQQTLQPAETQSGPPTQTPQPCNKALLVNENPADYTEFNVGDNFDKSWRLKNIGTCTWNTNYRLVFNSGEKMGGPASKNLTQSVAPGESIDITIDQKAPNIEGTYRGDWRIDDDQGKGFFFPYVIIKAKAILAPPIMGKPDLRIISLIIEPATPTMGANTHVRVKANNNGPVDSGGFRVQWYGLDSFTNPSCFWNVSGGLAAGASVWLECDFVFNSWYPINKTTIAIIDTNNSVDESNEGNNTKTISPFGVNP